MLHAEFSPNNSIKPGRRNISGVLLLDKPYGISSNKAVQIAKRVFSAAKCGHTGTLDPMATGLLPLCFGEATKFSSVLLGANKGYEATLKLGFLSTTGDAEGEIIQFTNTVNPTLPQCEQVLKHFVGKIMQIPPMYSALKYQGKPLYAYARNGEAIERTAREISIHEIQIKSLIENELQLSIQCGTGTYIRTLAEDIGKALGCGGAYLVKLRRTVIDRFDLSQAQTLSAVEEMDATERDNGCLLPIDGLLQGFPAVTLDELAAIHMLQGRIVMSQSDISGLSGGNIVRLYDHRQRFLGLGEITIEQKIAAKRLLANL
jgi:tRNA pseudouridine55 synthase